jgi:hypothetical protein
MAFTKPGRGSGRVLLSIVSLLATLSATGCQVDIGGQTLPSPYYMSDDVQYFPPGHEFKLANEAAAMAADRADTERPAE